MVEEDVAEDLSARKQPSLVALQAGNVIDFRPGVRAICTGEITHHHRHGFRLLLDFGIETRRDVALDAGDLLVR